MGRDRTAVCSLLLTVRGDYKSGLFAHVAECRRLAWHGIKLLGPQTAAGKLLGFPTGVRGLVVLAGCGAFANLLELDFFSKRLGDAGVVQLVASVFVDNAFPQLQWLGLRHNGMCDTGGRFLADAIVRRDCSLGSLVALDLSQNNISDMALTTLKAALATVPAMRKLYYSNGNGRVRSRFSATCHE